MLNKVFGIGLSRTGTTSLTSALEILGFKTRHFPSDLLTRQEILYALNQDMPRSLSLTLLTDYDALTDTPVAGTYQLLDRSYPGSRFIYTVRNKKDWIRSCANYWERHTHPLFDNGGDTSYIHYVKRINRQVYRTERFVASTFAKAYDEHEYAVQRYFADRQEDLLTLDICSGDGWERLCDFLKKPVPYVAFPWENKLDRL